MKFNKKRFLTLLLISSVALISINIIYIFIAVPRVKILKEEEPLRIVKTYEKNAVFYFDSKYLMAKKESLHKEASLELHNKDEEIYFVYIQNHKVDFPNFDVFTEHVQKQNTELYGEFTKTKEIDFLKQKAISTIFNFTADDIKVYIHSLIFEDKHGYHELLIWGEKEKAEQIDLDLLNIRIEFIIDS